MRRSEVFVERIFLNGMLDRDTSREVPFDATVKAALESTVLEADALDHRDVRPAHLLGILRHEGTAARKALMDAGVTLLRLPRCCQTGPSWSVAGF